MYTMHTVRVNVTYADNLTEGGRESVTVHVQDAYCQRYFDLCGYSNKGGRG